ncbi:uncharacterized protein EV420DRAFT_1751221, partial [Desarmillaria tabescens]
MALLDCVGSVVAHCGFSDCLHYLGDKYVFEFRTQEFTAHQHNVNPVIRGIMTYCFAFDSLDDIPPRVLYFENTANWGAIYVSLILATLLWCTILIVYRILKVGGIAAGMRVYRRVIEILVESTSLYSAIIVALLVFEVHYGPAMAYISDLAVVMRGIVPTILVGCVAAGHARPDDSWNEPTTVSSLRFKSRSSSQSDSLEMSAGSESNISPCITPDLENGLEDVEDHSACRVFRTSNSIDHGVV